MSTYDLQRQSQIEQYKDTENIHDLPPIYHYWHAKHLSKKITQVFDITPSSIPDLYASELSPIILQTKKEKYTFASIGSGEASIEADIYSHLKEITEAKIAFECFEISEFLIERGQANVRNRGVHEQIRFIKTDLNLWKSQKIYDGIIAHHSLHHILNLENLFSEIAKSLSPMGVFVSGDMIGRNGHMRWPEALAMIQSIWENMPKKYKYNRALERLEERYENWDCSNEGFEGIRSQDILKLLIKHFKFKKFLAYGNLIDLFIDRAFGYNFDPSNSNDLDFIDKVDLLNELLIDIGFLKPTHMLATMTVGDVDTSIIYKHWNPEFCIRDPEKNPLDAANPVRKVNLVGPIYQVGEALRYYDDQWISPRFYIELTPCQPIQGISIGGLVPVGYPVPNRISVDLNKKLFTYEILKNGSFSAQFKFDKPQVDKFYVYIDVERSVNGFLEGINQDRRNLAFLLQQIKVLT